MIDKIFWHPGIILGGFLEDIDSDGKIEYIGVATSNAFEKTVGFSIEYDKISGTAPANEYYKFLEQDLADFDHYVLLPKSKYNSVKGFRYNYSTFPPSIWKDKLRFRLDEDLVNTYIIQGFDVVFNKDFSNPDVIVLDIFRTMRDSLVVKGLLDPPYTDTHEYRKFLKDQIRYWNGEEFIKHDEYFRNSLSETGSQKLAAENR